MNNLTILREKVKTLSILLVDDEVDILNRLKVFMQKIFENVDSANSAEVALKKFSDHNKYDIVLTDIKMPGMSGWEFIKQLRKINNNQLFIGVLTGSEDATDKEIALCNSYIIKPVSIDKMIMMLEQVIEHQNKRIFVLC